MSDFNEDFNSSGNGILDLLLKTKSADIDIYVEETGQKSLTNESIKFFKTFFRWCDCTIKATDYLSISLRKLGLKI